MGRYRAIGYITAFLPPFPIFLICAFARPADQTLLPRINITAPQLSRQDEDEVSPRWENRVKFDSHTPSPSKEVPLPPWTDNLIPEKYQESNLLIAQRRGLPALVQQKIIVSNEDIRLAKISILYLKQEIKKLSNDLNNHDNNNNSSITSVWVPYLQYLAEVLPSDKGTDTRAINRIFSLLNIIPLAKANLRPRLVYGSETLVIANLEDLGEVLHITQNLNGMPTYKMKFFNEIFYPLYEEKSNQPLTTKELCERFRKKYGKAIDSDSMKKKYLNELRNIGIIGEEDSPDDKRQKIYIPVVERNSRDYINRKIYRKSPKNPVFDNFLQYSRITLPKNYRDIPENWLIFEILSIAKYWIDLDHFKGCLGDLLNQSEEIKFFIIDDKGTGFCRELKQFAEAYKVAIISTAVSSNTALGADTIIDFMLCRYNIRPKLFHSVTLSQFYNIAAAVDIL